jgi:predicted P-loop ATPase
MPDEAENVVQLRIAGTEGVHGDWRDKLIMGKRGILKVPLNAEVVLTYDERWRGVLIWDDFRQTIMFTREPPWQEHDQPHDRERRELSDSDIVRIQGWLCRYHGLDLGCKAVSDAVRVVAEQRSRHEVRDYLEGLTWDGTFRIPTWVSRYLGAEQTDYIELVSKFFLTSAVARVMSPGCKVDTMIVLEGEQGARKSTALRVLFGDEWFSDTPLDLESKDRFLAMQGSWCCEWPELDGMGRVGINRLKSFLSSQRDKFRPPYGSRTMEIPRQCVFAGTTNPQVYLRDETGNRRFWPILCGRIDIAGLQADRDQLWAEALLRYEGWRSATKGGTVAAELGPDERWWPDGPGERALFTGEQQDRMQLDPWAAIVEPWLEHRQQVTTSELLTHLNIEPGQRTRTHEMRAANVLASLRWVKGGRPRVGDTRLRVYVRGDK